MSFQTEKQIRWWLRNMHAEAAEAAYPGLRKDMRLALGELKKHREELKQLTATIRNGLLAIDRVMSLPESRERGQSIAKITNAMEMANDMARHFTLGESLKP